MYMYLSCQWIATFIRRVDSVSILCSIFFFQIIEKSIKFYYMIILNREPIQLNFNFSQKLY